MKVYKIILAVLILCFSQTVYAKPQEDTDYRLKYVNLDWWNKYNDENLTNHMMTAYNNNQDLKVASIKSKQADQAVKEAFAQELPYLGFSGSIGRELTSADTRFGTMLIPDYSQTRFLLPVTMTYEVDIWGENRLKTKSIEKQRDIIKQNERSAYINLTSQLASNYFNLIKLDKLIENQEQLVALQKKISEMQVKKFNSGLCSTVEVLIEKQALTVFEEELNDYKDKREVVFNQILVLLGDRNLKGISRNSYNSISLPEIPETLPTEAIAQRPDLIKAEDYIKKIGFDVRAAKRDFLPKFTIYGQAGFNAYNNLSHIFQGHTFLSNFGILPSIDIFTGGAKMAHFRFNKLEYEKAGEIYEKTILTSIQELNDSLSAAKLSKNNYLKSSERLDLEKHKYLLNKKKLLIGAKSQLDFLKDEEAVILSERNVIFYKTNYLISTINLYKAAGGVDYTKNSENL